MRGRRRQEQGGGGARVQVREKPAGAGNRAPRQGAGPSADWLRPALPDVSPIATASSLALLALQFPHLEITTRPPVLDTVPPPPPRSLRERLYSSGPWGLPHLMCRSRLHSASATSPRTNFPDTGPLHRPFPLPGNVLLYFSYSHLAEIGSLSPSSPYSAISFYVVLTASKH